MNAMLIAAMPIATVANEGQGAGTAVQIFMVLPFLLLLLAYPAAAVYRATVRFPARVAEVLTDRPLASRGIGLANLVLVVLVGSAAQGNRVLGGIAFLLFLAWLVFALIGLTGAAANLGRSLFAGRGNEDGALAFLVGWLLLAGMPLLPLLGFLYLLWFMTGAVGAALLALARK